MFRFGLWAIVLLTISACFVYSKPDAEKLLKGSTQGKSFYIAVPPNERGDLDKKALEIYVSSTKNTSVTLTKPDGTKLTKPVEAMKITTFSSTNNEISFNWEINDSEKINALKAIKLESPDSISVFFINSKDYSADGYMALPRSSWGNQYMHCGFYDNVENRFLFVYNRGGGFLFIADSNNTKCKVILRGVGKGSTMQGLKIGDTINVTLNQGEIYSVISNGKNHASFDLTGSELISDKPVGFISFHERTAIPSNENPDGKDHLSEFMPPIDTWGKEFMTIELKRRDRGDYFRVLAAYDNTEFVMQSYDKETDTLIMQKNVKLRKGEFWEYNNDAIKYNNPDNKNGIRGVARWKSNKPIFLMHYSYSASYDASLYLDPFMTMVVPTNQFVDTAIFQTPVGKAQFLYNWLNLIAVGDSTDKGFSLVKSVKLDGNSIYENDKNAFKRIPGTNYYWTTLKMNPGAHSLSASTRFGAYIYGFDDRNSYGWPAAMSVFQAGIDSSAPTINYIETCGKYDFTITEDLFGDVKDFPRQLDTGISFVMVSPETQNIIYTKDTLYKFSSQDKKSKLEFSLSVKDVSQNAFLKLIAEDFAGNRRSIELEFPSHPEFWYHSVYSQSEREFSTGSTYSMPIKIYNRADSAMKIRDITLFLHYPSDEMLFNSKCIFDSSNTRFNSKITSQELINGDSVTLRINCEIDDTLRSATIYPEFQLLLSHDSLVHFSGMSVVTSSSSICNFYHINASIRKDLCASELRNIKISNYKFEIKSISPNPANSSNIKVVYSIPFQSEIQMELYDVLGNRIALVNEKQHSAGENEITLDKFNLNASVYFIVLRMANMTTTQRFIVN